MRVLRRPSPAMVVACIALLIALSGSALAASPAVKRALFAENAGKLQGKSGAALVAQATARAVSAAAQQAGPASTAAGIVHSKSTAPVQLAADSYRVMTVSCDGGASITGGGFSSDGPVYSFDSYPSNSTTWAIGLQNPADVPHNVTLYAICVD
jgi:hypothetical protein